MGDEVEDEVGVDFGFGKIFVVLIYSHIVLSYTQGLLVLFLCEMARCSEYRKSDTNAV